MRFCSAIKSSCGHGSSFDRFSSKFLRDFPLSRPLEPQFGSTARLPRRPSSLLAVAVRVRPPMAQTKHKPSHQPSFHPTLCLITDNVNWKNNQSRNTYSSKIGNSQQKVIRSTMTSYSPADDFEIVPWICQEVMALSSLESNCESEISEDEMEDDETPGRPELGMDDDYVMFCDQLSKSPDTDSASARLFCATVFSGSCSFTITSDDECDFTDDEDDDEEEENDDDSPEPGGHDFKRLKFSNQPYCSSTSAKFDPLMISGLFLPALSLCSRELSETQPSLIFGTGSFCGSGGCDEAKGEEFADNERLKEVNKRWEKEYGSSVISTNGANVRCSNQESTRKKVHFSSEDTFISILNKVEWADDYEAARKGPWEQYYLDRLRFAKRIESANPVISRILDSNHRAAVFRNVYEGTDKDLEFVSVPNESKNSNLSAANISVH